MMCGNWAISVGLDAPDGGLGVLRALFLNVHKPELCRGGATKASLMASFTTGVCGAVCGGIRPLWSPLRQVRLHGICGKYSARAVVAVSQIGITYLCQRWCTSFV